MSKSPEILAPSAGTGSAASLWKRRPGLLLLRPEAAANRPRIVRGRVAFTIAVVWLVAVLVTAVLANLLPLARYDVIVPHPGPASPPRWSWSEPLGTDFLGRSVLSRLVFGARQSAVVAAGSLAIAMSVGTVVGVAAGYLRGAFDAAVGVLVDTMLAIPTIITLLAISAIGKRDMTTLVVALGIIGVPTFIRLARANTLPLADRGFVVAARAMGASRWRIIFRELLPNVLAPVWAFALLFAAFVIVAQATLSFLGLGVPPPTPSWGGMVHDSVQYLQQKPYLVFVPAGCIALTVASLTIIGDRLRGRFDIVESKL